MLSEDELQEKVLFIDEIKTRINKEVLERYCTEMPGCRRFLENFFLTCEPYQFEHNLGNYLMDIELYSPTNRAIRENRGTLMRAFYEIAEPCQGDDIDGGGTETA